jgi:hypothetical protein
MLSQIKCGNRRYIELTNKVYITVYLLHKEDMLSIKIYTLNFARNRNFNLLMSFIGFVASAVKWKM